MDRHTSFRIGGKGRWWFEPGSLKELVSFLKGRKRPQPYFVIGQGSNLLVREGVIDKVFIRLSSPAFTRISLEGRVVTAGAGVPLKRLVAALSAKDLCGHEFLAGIPGTLGGALVMNAGVRSVPGERSSPREVKDIVLEAVVLNARGELKKLKRKDIRFRYRRSSLKPYIILSAKMKLKKPKRPDSRRLIRALMKERIETQDWRYPSAGSIFRNPARGPGAGRLIDLCGLKGAAVGGACVSDRHANFIINKDRASSRDVSKLMEKIRKAVYDRFKIKLEPEVEVVS